MKKFIVGNNPLRLPIYAGIKQGFITLVQGQSGSGKTRLANNILIKMMETYGSNMQFAIIDPKQVGYLMYKKRCHIYPDQETWLPLIEALNNEMLRRYNFMATNELTDYPLTEENPFLLLVIDEMSAVTNNQQLLKKVRDSLINQLVSYTNQCRQAGMGLMLLCQSCDSSVMPTVIRSNCSTRFAMKTAGAEQVRMISGGRDEECPCDLLSLPGEFYAITSETNNKWVRGRTWNMSIDEELSLLQKFTSDKRTPYCLDWTNPEFLG